MLCFFKNCFSQRKAKKKKDSFSTLMPKQYGLQFTNHFSVLYLTIWNLFVLVLFYARLDLLKCSSPSGITCAPLPPPPVATGGEQWSKLHCMAKLCIEAENCLSTAFLLYGEYRERLLLRDGWQINSIAYKSNKTIASLSLLQVLERFKSPVSPINPEGSYSR